ncbi:electron transfer flavoprotein subunit alpha/FixB family protein (plasmid) [Cellulomonas sp. WB94]|uniref:electron transfer flavoprotein subunit alpha/FixB family protein n=1 Tax=Cellulomonas sp. WB94 TaxID=2173174 RepID=UPI000D57A73B|nr:electron transfer flavoprotein subunit alpha/FixB family protein [Cellulomonas sp. WB94]PVU84409.1 electron transfer flavoprotein subunit alpha/FixB family protein [Cellulomonas sp. WB94]
MNVTSQSWVVLADDPAVSALVEAARVLGTEVVALVVGRREIAEQTARAGVDQVVWLGEPTDGTPVEAYAGEVARIIADAAPRVVLGAATPAGRVMLGAVAARLHAPVLAGIGSVELAGDQVVVSRTVLGGIAEHRTAVSGGTAVLALAPGAPADAAGVPVAIEEVPATPTTSATITDVRVKEQAKVDLGAARTVVAIGRGLKTREDLALVNDLAEAIGGEVACSRPLAEGVDWVAKERYVGISGQHIAPDLYVAIGISGQLQHMVGVRGAKVVVAINSDKAAPIFAQCDYGIVGDLYQVVPALTAALGAGA